MRDARGGDEAKAAERFAAEAARARAVPKALVAKSDGGDAETLTKRKESGGATRREPSSAALPDATDDTSS